MMKVLDASHFKPAPRPPVTALPAVTRLASALGEACSGGLSRLRAAPWRVTGDGIAEVGEPPTDMEGTVLRFESERGSLTALLALDRQAVSAVLEAAMGGTGSEPAVPMTERPLSRIENAVLRLAHRALAGQIETALGATFERPFSMFEGDAPEPGGAADFVQFRFVLNVFSYSGEMSLTFVRDELEREIGVSDPLSTHDTGAKHHQHLQREIGRSEVPLTVTLGPQMLTLDAIAGMCPGKLIALTATADAPVMLWSGGVAAYEATLGRSGDRYAITITAALS